MKKTAAALILLVSLIGCKKAIENKKEDLLIKAMTDGQWAVTNFVYNGNTVTSDFANYKFQYYSDKTVDAIKNGLVDNTGTWDGDISARTTWANFNNVSNPLILINGSWHIDDNSWTFVVASQTSNGETKVMRLDKL
jgi:hypothetical protein